MMEKLTYYQICNLIALGKEKEIPDGYKLVWTTPEQQDLFDLEISGENIVVDYFPKPVKAYVSGKYLIVIPEDIMSKTKILEFGNVCVATHFALSKLVFEYDKTDEASLWMSKLEKPFIKKSDVVFNTTLYINDLTKIDVFYAMPKSLVDNQVELTYDYTKLYI